MNKDDAIKRIQRQIERIDEIKKKPSFSPEFEKWRRDTEVAIEKIFGKGTRHIDDFTNVRYFTAWSIGGTSKQEEDEKIIKGIIEAQTILSSFIDEIQEYWNDKDVIIEKEPIEIIKNLCNKFHLVAKRLAIRYDKRPPFIIIDEYDVQDLLYALLTLYFDDIRPEERTPSYAGKSSRMDFLLKEQQIIIETKKTRDKLEEKEVADQLIIDIQRYKAHPDCRTLICFVYDPEGRIKNPKGIENDLNKKHDNLEVKVIITPK